jgi:hypothetical protein
LATFAGRSKPDAGDRAARSAVTPSRRTSRPKLSAKKPREPCLAPAPDDRLAATPFACWPLQLFSTQGPPRLTSAYRARAHGLAPRVADWLLNRPLTPKGNCGAMLITDYPLRTEDT